MHRRFPGSLMLWLLIGPGCASSPLLSARPPLSTQAEPETLRRMQQDYPPGTRVLVQTAGADHRTEVIGVVREWNDADHQLVLEECALQKKGAASAVPDWLTHPPGSDWLLGANAEETHVAEATLPLGEIRSIRRASGESLMQRVLPASQETAGGATSEGSRSERWLSPPQTEPVDRDRERRIRASMGRTTGQWP